MQVNRRRFQFSIISGLWAVIAAALSAPAAAYLFAGAKARNRSSWIDAGDVSRLTVNKPEEFVYRRNRVDGWKVVSEKSTAWLVRKNDKEVVAFSPQCTHLGCAVHFVERTNEFLCPCHTSTFSLDGRVLSGPAPRALDQYEIRTQGNRLLLGEVRKVV